LNEDDPLDGPAGLAPDEPAAGASSEPTEARPTDLGGALEAPPEPGPAEEFHRRARLAEDRLAEVLTAYRQVKTENEGFRERITRNVERRFDQRRERLLLKFIDILDNLDRALEAAEQSYAGNPLIEGLILVRTSLLQTLQEEGLERIPVLGLPYDPNFSEAVATQPVEDPDHHHVVVKELLRGYRLNGRVARASRVLVGEFGRAEAQATVEDESLIGADETAVEHPVTAVPDPSLQELVALAEREHSAPEPPEAQEPAHLSEADFALGDPLPEAEEEHALLGEPLSEELPLLGEPLEDEPLAGEPLPEPAPKKRRE
jgi:molecular chaperone GrpE